jgi:predicted neuraminidase
LKWEREGVVHITPVGFAEEMKEALKTFRATVKPELLKRYGDDLDLVEKQSQDELYQRLGWMPRVHPIVLPSGRWILPLYTDTFSVSIMGLSDDQGKTWKASKPLIGWGNIQPALVRKKDGTLVAYMRENGLTHHIRVSESKDDGMTWSPVTSMDFPNPGASVDVVGLSNGDWVLIYNDSPRGRHTLAVSLSDDEGKTWKWTRHIQKAEKDQGSFHYPSIIQGSDGTIHASYTWNRPNQGSSIHHSAFNEAWIRQGDSKP